MMPESPHAPCRAAAAAACQISTALAFAGRSTTASAAHEIVLRHVGAGVGVSDGEYVECVDRRACTVELVGREPQP